MISQFASAQVVFQDLTLDEAAAKAKKENKLIFVDVYATWCRPCKMLDSEVFPNTELGDYFNKHFICLKIDGEKGDGPKIMKQYSLTAYPSLLFLNPEKEVVRKVRGFVYADQLLSQGKIAIDPSLSPTYAALKEFEKNPTRENHRNLILTYIEQDEDFEQICQDYLKKYPVLELENEIDFVVFYIVDNDINSLNMKVFLENTEEYSTEYVVEKLETVILHYLDISVEQKDISIVLDVVDIVFPAYYEAIEGEMEKEQLVEIIQEYYDEDVEE